MENWDTFEIFCPNCGKRLIGTINQKGYLVIECKNCFVSIRSKKLSRRKSVIEIEQK